jgi:hypothetical protein
MSSHSRSVQGSSDPNKSFKPQNFELIEGLKKLNLVITIIYINGVLWKERNTSFNIKGEYNEIQASFLKNETNIIFFRIFCIKNI